MTNGTIRKLVSDRGFGFIAPVDAPADGKDIFFHRADVKGAGFDALRERDTVTFDMGTDERRGSPKALNVQASK